MTNLRQKANSSSQLINPVQTRLFESKQDRRNQFRCYGESWVCIWIKFKFNSSVCHLWTNKTLMPWSNWMEIIGNLHQVSKTFGWDLGERKQASCWRDGRFLTIDVSQHQKHILKLLKNQDFQLTNKYDNLSTEFFCKSWKFRLQPWWKTSKLQKKQEFEYQFISNLIRLWSFSDY